MDMLRKVHNVYEAKGWDGLRALVPNNKSLLKEIAFGERRCYERGDDQDIISDIIIAIAEVA